MDDEQSPVSRSMEEVMVCVVERSKHGGIDRRRVRMGCGLVAAHTQPRERADAKEPAQCHGTCNWP